MNKTRITLLLPVAAIAIVLIAYLAGKFVLGLGQDNAPAYQTRGTLAVVCDVVVQRPVDGLTQPFEISKLMLPAVFDLDEGTAAYAGEYAISLNRKGTLHVNGDKLEVVRQAMFKRHGISIQGEYAELNRKNGEFRQWLDLGNDKRLELMVGKCKRPNNLPF